MDIQEEVQKPLTREEFFYFNYYTGRKRTLKNQTILSILILPIPFIIFTVIITHPPQDPAETIPHAVLTSLALMTAALGAAHSLQSFRNYQSFKRNKEIKDPTRAITLCCYPTIAVGFVNLLALSTQGRAFLKEHWLLAGQCIIMITFSGLIILADRHINKIEREPDQDYELPGPE